MGATTREVVGVAYAPLERLADVPRLLPEAMDRQRRPGARRRRPSRRAGRATTRPRAVDEFPRRRACQAVRGRARAAPYGLDHRGGGAGVAARSLAARRRA
jgi:hypothetical protein